MKDEEKPGLGRVAMFMALSSAAMFLLAGYVWARRPLDGDGNELAVAVLAVMGVFEMGLGLMFFRRSGW